MSVVYVRNKDGKPLMSTTRCGHVRILLKTGRARVVERRPFTIQLEYKTPDITQRLCLGIDPGRTNIGACVVDAKGNEKISVQVETRNKDVPKLMAERKAHRLHHRKDKRRDKRRRRARCAGTIKAPEFERMLPGYEKPVVLHDIRNKKARFNCRKRKPGWLTPTANHLLLTHLNVVKLLAKYVPITDVIIELNQFAFMAMDNPGIQPWEYQRGPLHGFGGDVKRTVSAQQQGRCIFCKSTIEHHHHITPRHCGGSDALTNIVGLCAKHHHLVHTTDAWKESLVVKKAGLNKKYGALSVLNQIIPSLVTQLGEMFPEHTFTVTGQDTKAFRDDNDVPKDHYLDAYCIASIVVGNGALARGIRPYYVRQFRRHDRQACHQEMLNRKYYRDGKLVATNRHRACEQTAPALDEYVAELRENMDEAEVLSTLSKLTVKPHPPRMKDTERALPGCLFCDERRNEIYVLQGYKGKHNGQPDYFVDTNGVKHLANKCRITNKNTGLRFVG